MNDLTWYFIPCHNYPRLCMEQFGQWPWWNPFSRCGTPYLGNPLSGLYYPPDWFCWRWDARDVLSWALVVHHLFAGMGTYLLCRCYGYGWTSSVLGGSIFLASPYLLAQTCEGHFCEVCAVAWIPWGLLAYERVRTGGTAGTAMLAAVLALSFFAGHAQETYYLVVILTALWIVDLVSRWRSGGSPACRRLLLQWIVLGVTVPVLVAVDLLPISVYARQSIRSEGLSSAEAGAIGLSFPNLFQLLNPFALGGPDSYAGTDGYFWETLCAFGLTPLLLASVGVVRAWTRYPVQRFVWCTAVAIAFAFGTGSPVFRVLFSYVPGLSFFRVPSRSMFFCSVAVAILAAGGFESLLVAGREQHGQARTLAARLNLPGAFACALAACLLWLVAVAGRAGPAALVFTTPAHATEETAAQSPGQPLLALAWRRTVGNPVVWAWFFASLGLVLGMLRWPARGQGFGCALLALCVVELALYANQLVAVLPAQALAKPSRVSELVKRQTGRYRILAGQYQQGDQDAWENGLEKVRGYDPVPLTSYLDFFAAVSDSTDPVSDVIGFSSLDASRLRTRLLDLLNVRFVVLSREPPATFGWQLLEEGALGPFYMGGEPRFIRNLVYENPNVLPRAFVVGQTRLLSRDEDLRPALAELNPQEELLASSEQLPSGPRASFAPARIIEYTPNRVVVEAELSGAGYLFLADTWYPGWSAEDNGRPISVIRADVAFRAVALSAGTHQVIFRYQPSGLWWGSMISMPAWCAWCLVHLALLIRAIRGARGS
ncbi:MAG: YfhO family protein [Planctomycetes bacterium]|nr:YfhO family protein [Planctomycetota bacterium]